MYSRVKSAVCHGMNGLQVEIETHISMGLPFYSVVGLPSAVIKESKERVRAALKSSGEAYPDDRITQSLFPAYEKKEGSQLDLPLAVGIYAAVNEINTGGVVFLGELSLDGEIKPIKNFVSLILTEGLSENAVFVAPAANQKEADALLDDGFRIYYYNRLEPLLKDLKSGKIEIPAIESVNHSCDFSTKKEETVDFSDICGQEDVVRALKIAAVGRFHTMLYGPPGCGKTMMATRFSTILPTPTRKETIEISRVYGDKMIGKRPVRTPHHSITKSALIGGGVSISLGEITKANHGVLVLDEFGEYKKEVLEQLREPLEKKEISLARSTRALTLPADFLLIATMNPCHCGRYRLGEDCFDCTCSQAGIKKYYDKLSWPLIDRMGIFVEMGRVDINAPASKSSAEIRQEVEDAVEFGRSMPPLEDRILEEARQVMDKMYEQDLFTLRSANMSLKVAESIANLEHVETIERSHIEEAVNLSPAVGLADLHRFM